MNQTFDHLTSCTQHIDTIDSFNRNVHALFLPMPSFLKPPTPNIRSSSQFREFSNKMRRTLIPPRIIVQVQLVIILSVPPLPRFQNLRRDRCLLPPLLLHLLCHFLRFRLLFRRVIENGAAVLGPAVHALTIFGSGVVHFVEELEESGVGELFGVEGHLERFGV